MNTGAELRNHRRAADWQTLESTTAYVKKKVEPDRYTGWPILLYIIDMKMMLVVIFNYHISVHCVGELMSIVNRGSRLAVGDYVRDY